MNDTRTLPKNYLASHAYWALVSDTEPRLKGVEIGELTNYLNGTSKKLRENLRYAVKIIQREIEDINTEEERKAEIEEERRARKREWARQNRAAAQCGKDSRPQASTSGDAECKEKELLPPAPPTKEKEPACVSGITLDSEHIAGATGAQDAGEAAVKRTRFVAPSVEEVAAYIDERGYHFDAGAFVDFYASKGWKVGQTPMKDWRAACGTWERRRIEGGGISADDDADQPEPFAETPIAYPMH